MFLQPYLHCKNTVFLNSSSWSNLNFLFSCSIDVDYTHKVVTAPRRQAYLREGNVRKLIPRFIKTKSFQIKFNLIQFYDALLLYRLTFNTYLNCIWYRIYDKNNRGDYVAGIFELFDNREYFICFWLLHSVLFYGTTHKSYLAGHLCIIYSSVRPINGDGKRQKAEEIISWQLLRVHQGACFVNYSQTYIFV